MSAALIENDNQYMGMVQETPIMAKKRQSNSHNKTQKRTSNIDLNNDKVNSVLATIHNSFNNNDDSNNLGDFVKNSYKPLNPLEPPQSMKMEGMSTISNTSSSNGRNPNPVENEDMDLQNLDKAFMNDEQVNIYYKKLMANNGTSNSNSHNNNYNQLAKKYYETNKIASNSISNYTNSNTNDNNQVLIEKLNYMINLLEDQQDERTGSVTEEIVLYSFLGIFVIFVADSFVRVGKYVR